MIPNLPAYISFVFILTTFLALIIFYKAANNSRVARLTLTFWLLLQTIISLTGFYTVTNHFPPRFLLLPFPPVLFIATFFFTTKGRLFIDGLDLKMLTLLHIVRIPVELVLYWLFLNKQVPELMTFAGRNFDILSGLTAPIVWYFGFVNKQLNKKIILAWNFICVALLLNIIVNAVLSAPFPFQQFGFEQPNVAVLYFPFVWLPCCVVPLVLFSHLAAIRQLINQNNALQA